MLRLTLSFRYPRLLRKRAVRSKPKSSPPSPIATELRLILDQVAAEAQERKYKGETLDIEYVHRRAQEKLYEKRMGHASPSALAPNGLLVPPAPIHNLRRIYPLEHLYKGDLWPQSRARPLFPDDADEELIDASDEFVHWEIECMRYLRENELALRKSLPFLKEVWAALSLRLKDAEQRYIAARNKILGLRLVSFEAYVSSEQRLKEVRDMCAETYQAQYRDGWFDPREIKSSASIKFLKLSQKDFLTYVDELILRRSVSSSEFLE